MPKSTPEDPSSWRARAQLAADGMAAGGDGGDGGQVARFHEIAATGSDVHCVDEQPPATHADDNNAGDFGKFDEIARRHKTYLQQKARHLTGDKESSKDLMQDTLLRALENFDKFQQGSNARAWLVRIMLNRLYDLSKHQRVVSNASIHLAADLLAEDYETSFGMVTKEQLMDAIGRLDPKQREVIECCYFKNMKYKDAARCLGVPVGTIGTRLKCARERLKAMLHRAGREPT